MWPEALPAFAIIAGCVTFTGLALRFLDKYEHNGKVSLGLIRLLFTCTCCWYSMSIIWNGVVLYLC